MGGAAAGRVRLGRQERVALGQADRAARVVRHPLLAAMSNHQVTREPDQQRLRQRRRREREAGQPLHEGGYQVLREVVGAEEEVGEVDIVILLQDGHCILLWSVT